MAKRFAFTLFFTFFFLFNNALATSQSDHTPTPSSPMQSDDPWETPAESPSRLVKPKRKRWEEKQNLEATDSDDSGLESGRQRAPGSKEYHARMIQHYRGKGAFHHGLSTYAPKGREERFIAKHAKEVEPSYIKEKRHERWARGLEEHRYESGMKNKHRNMKPAPKPPTNQAEAIQWLDDRHQHFKNDEEGPQYLLPQTVTNGERKRRHGEPHRNFNLNASGKESSSETESESEPEYRKQLKRKYRKLSHKT